jgi:L-lactate dehydrogenase (cytochrome)
MSARGEDGLADLLAVFQKEIAITMALMGVNRVEDITPELLES